MSKKKKKLLITKALRYEKEAKEYKRIANFTQVYLSLFFLQDFVSDI